MPADPTAPLAPNEPTSGRGDSTADANVHPNDGDDPTKARAKPTGSTLQPEIAAGGVDDGPATSGDTATDKAPKRMVTGRYVGTANLYRVELRIDADGPTTTKRVSADYYAVNGATASYLGSMRLDAATLVVDSDLVTITGMATFTFTVSAPRIKVAIPRVAADSPPAAAVLQHLNDAGTPTTTFTCPWVSDHLRSVLFEQARQSTVADLFVSYDTASLPSGGAARTLSVIDAYAEAGVQMQTTGVIDVVDTSEAGSDDSWSDAELHAAMVNHFSLWKDMPQWAVWLFHADVHDLGPGLLGLMFDDKGANQRQGAATFYAGMAGNTADKQRLQLFCCTHELGHSFNLLHSWQKSLATPPTPNRPGALSWMNYPERFTGGEAAFWNDFGFTFDTPELIHLRHGFRDDVIHGGNSFGGGAALQTDVGWDEPADGATGMELTLAAPTRFLYGEPVAVDLQLRTRGTQRTPTQLRPRNGGIDIAIKPPSGTLTVYSPLLRHCWVDQTVTSRRGDRPATDSAFIHYGADGFYFDTPGRYQLRARFVAGDGSIVMSNVVDIHVQPPLTRDDVGAAELLFGDDQGKLMYLVGSDFDGLRTGNDALTELRERYEAHPLAQVARVVQGTNAAREFKTVGPLNTVSVRPPDHETASVLLGEVLDVTAATKPAPRQMEVMAMNAMIATRLDHPPVTRQAEGQIGAYIRSRRREIAVELGGRGRDRLG